MKHNPIILMTLLLGLTLFGCKKQEQETLTPKITNDKVETTATTATFTWTVEWKGNRISVVEVSENEDMSDSRFYGSEEELNKTDFLVTARDLKPNTKYYYRHWVWNQHYVNNKFVMATKDFSTLEEFKVSVLDVTVNSSSVTVKCSVTGGDVNTNRGVCWSTSSNPVYNGNHQSSGTGNGSFTVNLYGLNPETQYHVRAYAVNNIDVAYSDDMTFTTSAAPQAPTGAINGLFSVSETKKVWFSKGNLQYIGSATTPYWKFADSQWAVIGTNGQGSTAPNVDRDLFGWGTSGYHDGNDAYNTQYQPYSTSRPMVNWSYNEYGYGPSTNQNNRNISGTHYDWGVHNAIYNGGNWPGLWRTLTSDEWEYVFNGRSASTVNGTPNARYAKGKVNDVKGVILFPDSYTHPSGLAAPFGINDAGSTGWNYNSYSESDWSEMEARGCVFLPAAGYRDGTSVNGVGSLGYYWSASHYNEETACLVYFDDSYLKPAFDYYRFSGLSVRLVCPAE